MIEFTGIEIGLLQDALRFYYREMRDDGYDSVRRRMLARLDKAVSLDEDVHNILIKLGTIPPDPPVEIDD